MKSLLKFTLLSALIISGKLAKQPASATVARTVEVKMAPDTSLVFVNQMTINEQVKPVEQKAPVQRTSVGLFAHMF